MEEVVVRILELALALAGAYALALWFALVVWTYRDIATRSESAVTHIFSTLIVVLFWVPGALIYLLLRPRETLDDVFQRSMEEEYLLQDLEEFPVCPECHRPVRDEFLYCPHCRTALRAVCASCHRLVELHWEACPYCASTEFEDLDTARPGVAHGGDRNRFPVNQALYASDESGRETRRVATASDPSVGIVQMDETGPFSPVLLDSNDVIPESGNTRITNQPARARDLGSHRAVSDS